jgi:hypothetical protein
MEPPSLNPDKAILKFEQGVGKWWAVLRAPEHQRWHQKINDARRCISGTSGSDRRCGMALKRHCSTSTLQRNQPKGEESGQLNRLHDCPADESKQDGHGHRRRLSGQIQFIPDFAQRSRSCKEPLLEQEGLDATECRKSS